MMGKAFLHGNGGSNILALTVLGGTTQPASPKENTIWVNTGEAISEWVFSATQPTTRTDSSALEGGEIWFRTGSVSPAAQNILKKNGAFEYPNACYQYISGAWATKTAKTYQGGAWGDWALILFKSGYFDSDALGTFREVTNAGDGTAPPVIGDTYITHNQTNAWSGVSSDKMIDPTPFTVLKFTCSIAKNRDISGTSLYFQLGTSRTDLHYTGIVARYVISAPAPMAEYSLDISAANENTYVQWILGGSYGNTMKISDLRLQ